MVVVQAAMKGFCTVCGKDCPPHREKCAKHLLGTTKVRWWWPW
jgi:hypothetical protein